METVDGSIVLRRRRNLLEMAGAFAGPDSLGDFIIEEHRRDREEEDVSRGSEGAPR